MLPTTSSFRIRSEPDDDHHHGHTYSRSRSRRPSHLEFLTTRARVTNLAVLLIGACTGLSLLLNASFYLHSTSPSDGGGGGFPTGLMLTVDRGWTPLQLNHLVVVPAHAVWEGRTYEERLDEEKWTLESYQTGGGRLSTFVRHIEEGLSLTMMDAKALLVFSGGQTRPNSSTTEAESYMRLALTLGSIPRDNPPWERATTENYALDSYQNLLFSIARFREYTGHYPSLITVIGYDMKKARFTDLHRVALRWPNHRFEYFGYDPEGEEKKVAEEGEKQNGYIPYSKDMYGCHDFLLDKRKGRNKHIRFHPYYTTNPKLTALFNWCPGGLGSSQTSIFSGALPWDNLHQ